MLRLIIPAVLTALFVLWALYRLLIKKDLRKQMDLFFPGIFFIGIWAIMYWFLL